MSNGARFGYLWGNQSYYFKFDGGGLNALHITNSDSTPYGQVTPNGGETGTFYISDTGGRGYDDDAILMIAVNDSIEDFSIHIDASGYQWEPTADGTAPLTVAHNSTTLDRTFNQSDFLTWDGEVEQIWKPYTTDNYPIFYGQDMNDEANTFHLMFIDLNAGVLGINYTYVDKGMAKVNYSIEGAHPGTVVFNAYTFCNQSNQQRGVSWTNAVTGDGASGWMVP